DRVLVQGVNLRFAKLRRLGSGFVLGVVGGFLVVAPVALAPAHLLGDRIDPLGIAAKGLIKAQVAMDGVVLLAEVALPIKFIPRQVAPLLPLIFRATVRFVVAHSVARN